MALLVPAKTCFGFDVEEAYCRVDSLSMTRNRTCSFLINSYLNQEVSQSVSPLSSSSFAYLYDLDGPNPIKQAYLHLKTLPEFADAIDC